MSEYYDKSVLLYRIISLEKRIEFIYVTDKINALDTINDEDICNLSFDELLRDTIEFRQHYPAIKSILTRLMVAVYKEGAKELEEILNELDVFNTDSNYILKYYINKFKKLFNAEHAYMNHLALQLKAKKENRRFKLKINKIIETLQIIADQDYFSSLSKITQPILIPAPDCFINPESDVCVNYGEAILVINNQPIIYEIADISLLKFFNKLNYKLYEMEQYIYNCKHCHKEFFGNLGASYCSAPACQKELKRLERNRKERERQNSPYIKPKTSLNNYISTYKTIFRKKVNDDAYWIEKFEAEEQRIKDIVKEEVERREKAKLPTDDDDMNQFIINHKRDMYKFMYNLLDEYGNNNS